MMISVRRNLAATEARPLTALLVTNSEGQERLPGSDSKDLKGEGRAFSSRGCCKFEEARLPSLPGGSAVI
jgi:hypothetical protein